MTDLLVALSIAVVGGVVADSASASVVSCDPCVDRTKVRLAVVDHGVRGADVFWDAMDVAIHQGAKDVNVNLTHSSATENAGLDNDAIFERMSSEIEELCGGGGGGGKATVDGVLVTLPDPSVLEALETCDENGIPVVAFNAGIDLAKSAGYLFFGQNATDAGYEAGSALASINGTEKFCCINHAPGVDTLIKRCEGMVSGISSTVETYRIFEVVVGLGNCTAWTETVHDMCRNGDDGNWSTVGLFVAGANHDCAVEFLREYPDAHAAFSDVSEYMYDGVRDGLNILFGIDQQAYLQGYLPFSFLTLAVTNGQVVGNDVIMTGPHLVTAPPDANAEECAANAYAVCDDEGDHAAPISTDFSPASRSLRRSFDGFHQVVIAAGGFAVAIVGGYVLAN
ncbi:hypothetical protein ACHAW5_010363 [Stephanodiscus triporus]|uniref:Periplasmic binding protein domain-containing protein n=1 Tax=Stephanodiscus triporus TaxID=2934178 RepID=A0ABD3NBH1_9STRA